MISTVWRYLQAYCYSRHVFITACFKIFKLFTLTLRLSVEILCCYVGLTMDFVLSCFGSEPAHMSPRTKSATKSMPGLKRRPLKKHKKAEAPRVGKRVVAAEQEVVDINEVMADSPLWKRSANPKGRWSWNHHRHWHRQRNSWQRRRPPRLSSCLPSRLVRRRWSCLHQSRQLRRCYPHQPMRSYMQWSRRPRTRGHGRLATRAAQARYDAALLAGNGNELPSTSEAVSAGQTNSLASVASTTLVVVPPVAPTSSPDVGCIYVALAESGPSAPWLGCHVDADIRGTRDSCNSDT